MLRIIGDPTEDPDMPRSIGIFSFGEYVQYRWRMGDHWRKMKVVNFLGNVAVLRCPIEDAAVSANKSDNSTKVCYMGTWKASA